MRKSKLPTLAVVALSGLMLLSGCSNLSNQQERALSGGAIGAGLGIGAGALTGGSLLAGGLIGGAAGAAVGAFTSDDQVKVNP